MISRQICLILMQVLSLSSVFGLPGTSSSVVLPWGKEKIELGLFQDGDYRRGPFFFSVDQRGFFFIADAYKERVAVYDAKGQFQQEIPLSSVSPRMTFFQRTEDQTFVLCNDQEVSRWNEMGEPLGRKGLGFALPSHFYANSTATILVFKEVQDEFSLVFAKDFSSEKRLALRNASGGAAALQDLKGRFWLVSWENQAATFQWKAQLPKNATLFAFSPEGNSVWIQSQINSATLYKVDMQGKLLGKTQVFFDEAGPKDASLTTDPNLDLFQGRWLDSGFEIKNLPWGP